MDKKEAKIQADSVITFADRFPHLRGNLFATFHEVTSGIEGSMKKSLGLVRGVSDLIYIDSYKRIGAIEMKAPETYHDIIHVLEQCRFMLKNAAWGRFCISIEDVISLVESNGIIGGITPEEIIKRCNVKCESNDIDDILIAAQGIKRKVKF